jgi:hypothetical protein
MGKKTTARGSSGIETFPAKHPNGRDKLGEDDDWTRAVRCAFIVGAYWELLQTVCPGRQTDSES